MLYIDRDKKNESKHKISDYAGVQCTWEGEPLFLTYSCENHDNYLIEIDESGIINIYIRNDLLEKTWEDILMGMYNTEEFDYIEYLEDFDIFIKKRKGV